MRPRSDSSGRHIHALDEILSASGSELGQWENNMQLIQLVITVTSLLAGRGGTLTRPSVYNS